MDRGDEPVLEPKPGEIRLWSDTLVRALFENRGEPTRHAALGRLGCSALDRTSPRPRGVARSRTATGSGCGSPTGSRCASAGGCGCARHVAEPPDDPDAVVVRLDPGLAFGTGTHPTTALCLQMLDSLPLAGRTVIDYGCGSGILGIAALKLGAAHVDGGRSRSAGAHRHARQCDAQRRRSQMRDSTSRASPPPRLPPAICVVANILAGR